MTDKSHKLAAIVFTDIVGYTKRMEKDEQQTMRLLNKQREILFPLIKLHGGEVIKEIGDGLLMMFTSAVDAVRFAIDAQETLKDDELTIRAGIHIGDVIFKDNDVFGSAVNTAARIEPLAEPNGICISEDVRNQIRNKSEIRTRSLGEKNLKGVDEPVKIYEILLNETGSTITKSSQNLFKDIWSRRVVHILAAYVFVAFLFKQAISAMVFRYLLSPHLVDLSWIILLSLIPTVFLLSYFHSKKRSKKWHLAEQIGLPLNLVITILLIVFLFQGKDLGAATDSVIIKNEEGESVERTILKSEFRKKIAIFYFENNTGDTSLDWMQYGFTILLNYDLSQDIFIHSQPAQTFNKHLTDAGFKDGLSIPLMLQKKIAEIYGQNYFLDGTIDRNNGEYIIATSLHSTSNGKIISEFEYAGKDIFGIADKISAKLLSELDIPVSYKEKPADLPVEEIFTNSVDAFKYFTIGNTQINLYNNWEKGLYYTEMAAKEDPGFAVALVTLAEYYFNSNQLDLTESTLLKTMDNMYKLPERHQFNVKFFYYVLKQEPDKAIAVLKMWSELYPEDIEAHERLATRYQYKNMVQESICEYKKILELDPEQTMYIRYIGDLFQAMGEYDSAMLYFRNYADQHPDDYKSYRNIGELYLNTGDFQKANENFDKALALEPKEIDVLLNRNLVEIRLGNYKTAQNKYFELLPICKSATDSNTVYIAIKQYYELIGKTTLALNYHKQTYDLIERFGTPLNLLVYKLFNVETYVSANKSNDGFQIIEDCESEFEPPLDKVAAFGYLFYYIAIEDVESARAYLQDAKDLAIGFGEEMLLNNVYYAEGRIFELEDKVEDALNSYRKYEKNLPTESIAKLLQARCHRKLGDLNIAEEMIAKALEQEPYHPKYNYEAALIYIELKEIEKGIVHLHKSVQVWENADDYFKPATKARAKLIELESLY